MPDTQLPAVINEAGTIDSDGVATDRLVSEPALFRRVNIAAGLSRANARTESTGTVISTPLVRNANILHPRNPAFTQRAAVAGVAVGSVNFDSFRVFPMQDIFRGCLPA